MRCSTLPCVTLYAASALFLLQLLLCATPSLAQTACPDLAPPTGSSSIACSGQVTGEICTMECDADLVTVGDAVRTCTVQLNASPPAYDGAALECQTPPSSIICEDLPQPLNGVVKSCVGFTQTQTCSFVCKRGYTPSGVGTRTCLSTGLWTENPLTCTPTACDDIQETGGVQGDCVNKVEGDKCEMSCDSGFEKISGSDQRTCSGGSWTGTALACAALKCVALPTPLGGSGSCDLDKAECVFACDGSTGGTVGSGDTTRSCVEGEWTGSPLVCTERGTCIQLDSPEGAELASCYGKVKGDICTFSCDVGYSKVASDDDGADDVGATIVVSWGYNVDNASPTIKAGDTVKWVWDQDGDRHDVVSGMRSDPDGVFDSGMQGKGTEFSRKFEDVGVFDYFCTPHPSMNAEITVEASATGSASFDCLEDGSWDGSDLVCAPKPCPDINTDTTTGSVAGTCAGYVHGDSCEFQCLNGYVANSGAVRECVNGAWDPVEPLVCSAMKCPDLGAPFNSDGALSECVGAEEGEECTFACGKDFRTVGDVTRTCQNGAWTGFVMICSASEERYVWLLSAFGECSVECGRGSQTRSKDCYDSEELKVVDLELCKELHPAEAEQECNLQSCSATAWEEGEYGECNAVCNGGDSERSVTCTIAAAGGEPEYVNDSVCLEDGKPKPETSVPCNTEKCKADTVNWSTSEWSDCSRVCGEGTNTRSVYCLDDNNNNRLPSACDALLEPAHTQPCNTHPCGDWLWSACDWEPCTAECNGAGGSSGVMSGTKQRFVYCSDGLRGPTVDDVLCETSGLTKPITQLLGCNPQECTAPNWMTSEWSTCIESKAGSNVGVRRRDSHCHGADGSNEDNTVCLADEQPSNEQSCTIGQCVGSVKEDVKDPKDVDDKNLLKDIDGLVDDESKIFITIGIAAGATLGCFACLGLGWWKRGKLGKLIHGVDMVELEESAV